MKLFGKSRRLKKTLKRLFDALELRDSTNDYSSFDLLDYMDLWEYIKVDKALIEEIEDRR
jgi:hypothetical protein